MERIFHKIYSHSLHHRHHHHQEGQKKGKPHDNDKPGMTPYHDGPSEPLDFLASAHLQEANGFHLRSKEDESPTSLEIKPTLALGMGQVSVSISRWRMETLASPPSSASSSSSSSWTKLSISLAVMNHSKTGKPIMGADEALKFRHRSRPSSSILGGGHGGGLHKDSRFVDVYFPHTGDELLGWIKYSPEHPSSNYNFEDAWVINDLISKTVFLTSPLELATEDLRVSSSGSSSTEMILGMRISTVEDLTVASVQAKRGMRQRRTGQISWTDWKLHFTPEFSTSLPSSAKAVILVASIVWVLNWKERERYAGRALSRRQNSAE